MKRWLVVSLLAACAGREVSKIKYTHTTCEDPGCSVPAGEVTYVVPDEERGMPPADGTGQPPEPTCELVGETLASIEVGNYAEPEERAPSVAAGAKRCGAMKLSREDRQCVVDSADRASVAYCVPALFPEEPQGAVLTQAQCDGVAKAMMTQLEANLRANPQPDQRTWERQLLVAIEACRADRWNSEMAGCAQAYVPMYAENCAYVRPTGMYKRLEARLAKAK